MGRRHYKLGGSVPMSNDVDIVIAGNGAEPQVNSPAPPTEPADHLLAQVTALTHAEREQARLAQQQRQPVPDGITPGQMAFLRAHPDLLSDVRQRTRLPAAHIDAIDAGHAPDSDGYFEFLSKRLGYDQPQRSTPAPAPTRHVQVSAPVSRDAPGHRDIDASFDAMRGRVNLTAQEREAAKIAGITDVEYAQQLLKMRGMQRRGEMQGGGA